MRRQQVRSPIPAGVAIVVIALLTSGAWTGSCGAGTISYGDKGPVPPGVTFTNIAESSATDDVPLYGEPTAYSTGLDFNPSSFAAVANGGSSDVTDGQLNFTVMGAVNLPDFVAINSLSLYESGDFTLAGTGTAATQAIAGAIIQVTVTQINGIDVAPMALIPVNVSVAYDLANDPGVVQPWDMSAVIDIVGQLPQGQVATKVNIAIDNQLLAFSEAQSVAFIAKKEFLLGVGTHGEVVVPEPSSLGMVLSALMLIWPLRRKIAS